MHALSELIVFFKFFSGMKNWRKVKKKLDIFVLGFGWQVHWFARVAFQTYFQSDIIYHDVVVYDTKACNSIPRLYTWFKQFDFLRVSPSANFAENLGDYYINSEEN